MAHTLLLRCPSLCSGAYNLSQPYPKRTFHSEDLGHSLQVPWARRVTLHLCHPPLFRKGALVAAAFARKRCLHMHTGSRAACMALLRRIVPLSARRAACMALLRRIVPLSARRAACRSSGSLLLVFSNQQTSPHVFKCFKLWTPAGARV